MGGLQTQDFESAQRSDGGSEITEYMPDGTYRVSRCAPDGRLDRAQIVAPLRGPEGPVAVPVMSFTSDGGDGGSIAAGSYLADRNGVLVRDSNTPKVPTQTPIDVLPPTQRRALSWLTLSPAGRMSRGAGIGVIAQAAQSDASCFQEGYSFAGYLIYTGYYPYEARISSMPNGDADRVAITRGHHTWNNTTTPCGFPDVTDITATYIGAGNATVHTYIDDHNVIDFGDPSVLGCSVPSGLVLVACTLSQTRDGTWAADIDQRYTNRSGFFYNGTGTVPSNRVDLWSTASHESGHAVGMNHSGGNLLTMFATVNQGQLRARDLGLGDARGFRCRYGITEGGC